MNIRTTLAGTTLAAVLIAMSGCAVTRGQESTGAYIDDAAITTAVKSRFVENKEVDASSISVETLKGTVMLTGFAKNSTEKTTAEALAWKVKGVQQVKNEITRSALNFVAMSTDTRTGRDIETLRRHLEDAKQECERHRVDGPEEVFLQAYVTVKAIELQLDEKLRQPLR